MVFGELARYGLVFGCSALGGLIRHLYSSAPANLRIKLEQQGNKFLRQGDPLYLYKRNIINNRDKIKDLNIEALKGDISVEPTDEQGYALIDGCNKTLFDTARAYQKTVDDVTTYCEGNGG